MLDNAAVAKIIDRLRSQDPHALDDFLKSVAPTLQRYGLRMCQNEEDAQDIAQESLIAAMKNVDSFRGEASVSSWLYTIARSFCIKKRRRGKFTPKTLESLQEVDSSALHAPTAGGTEEVVHRRQFEAALNRVLDSLDETQREVFVLRDMEGLSAKEVGVTLGISESAVKSRLHRARDNVRLGMKGWFETFATPTAEVKKSVEPCKRARDIPLFFSKFLEGDLNGALCAELKLHVKECPDCKPLCDCIQTTLQYCAKGGTEENMSEETLQRLRLNLQKCVDGSFK